MTVSGNVGSKDLTDKDLAKARHVLRQEQATHAHRSGAPLPSHQRSNLEPALQALQWRKQFEPANDPGVVSLGLWKFEREIEEERLRLAEDLIRRVDPGPFEDPYYLAFLAYQAASVEMATGHRPDSGDQRWSRFLLGTIASAEVNAFAKVLGQGGYTVVGVHSALIDFIYQAAKALVAAEHPIRCTDGKAVSQANVRQETIENELSRNPEPVDHLYRTLEAYFFKGYPRALSNEKVGEKRQQQVLDNMVSISERFVIAHEYGHAYAKDIDWQVVAAASNIKWVQEFSADQIAMVSTVLSGQTLDHFDPAVSLSGGIFSLACLSILAQGISILLEGKVLEDEGSDSHPPVRMRAEKIVEGFHKMFHAEFRPDGRGCYVTMITNPGETEEVEDAVREHIRGGAFGHANTLFVIWKRVREMLLHDYDSGRPLHPMWTATGHSS